MNTITTKSSPAPTTLGKLEVGTIFSLKEGEVPSLLKVDNPVGSFVSLLSGTTNPSDPNLDPMVYPAAPGTEFTLRVAA